MAEDQVENQGQQTRALTIVEKVLSPLEKPWRASWDLGLAIPEPQREEKAGGLFPFSPYSISNWQAPIGPVNVTSGYYSGTFDYNVLSGDLIDNSAVMACLNWLMRNFPKSTPRVVLETEDGLEPVVGHELTKKLKRPNGFYAGTQLWQATVLSYNWNGNAYWRKVRNGMRQVIQLWYEPHWNMRPVRSNANEYVSKYQVWRDSKWGDVPTEDVVHFRWGLDPRNDMMGLSPLASALREVFTDNEASRYAAIMFKNRGLPPVIISSADGETPMDYATAQRIKAEWIVATTGDARGEPVVAVQPLKFEMPDLDPSKMDTRGNRKISEERVSALLLIPASVAGLGAGLDRNTYNNAEDAIRRAYDDNILPSQDSMAEELDIQLLPDFSTIEQETIEFDQSKVGVLRGDQERKDTVTALLWNAGAITLGQTSIRLGYPPPDDGTELLRKPELAPPPTPPVLALAPGQEEEEEGEVPVKRLLSTNGHRNGNSNGHAPSGDSYVSHDAAQELAMLVLTPGYKAKKDAEAEREKIEAAIRKQVQEEIEAMYDELAGEVLKNG